MNRINSKKIFSFSAILRLAAIGLLLWSGARHKYDYYTLLRWIVSFTAGYCGYLALELENKQWAVILIGLIILFNPIFPIKLSKNTWLIIDYITALVLLVSMRFINEYKVDKSI